MKQKAIKSQNLCYLIFKTNNTKCISLQSTNRQNSENKTRSQSSDFTQR